ncbi:hypothetical protein ABIC60_003733 [Phyllobacterium ifriqiyense]
MVVGLKLFGDVNFRAIAFAVVKLVIAVVHEVQLFLKARMVSRCSSLIFCQLIVVSPKLAGSSKGNHNVHVSAAATRNHYGS